MKQILQTRIEIPYLNQSCRYSKNLIWAIVRFFIPPFSLPAATLLAFALGALSPFLLMVLDKDRFRSLGATGYNYEVFPWLSAVPAMFLIALLFWKTQSRKLPWNRRQVIGAVLGLLLLIEAAALSYYGCLENHMCMDGHLQHAPYTKQPYVMDSAWAFGLIVATLSFARAKSPLSILAAFTSGFLISMRFKFGSFGSLYPFF